MSIPDIGEADVSSRKGSDAGHTPVRRLVSGGMAAIWLCVQATAVAGQEVSSGDVVSGRAEVVDADIIRFGNQRVILWGIDAIERRQNCYRDGQVWDCYRASLRLLQTLAGRGETTCYLTGEPDPFDRRFGVCESGDDEINAEMVRAGMALAYSEQTDAYEDVQMKAIENESGVWQIGVEFQEPWAFRQANTPGGYR